MTTTNLSDFGYRELAMLEDLLKAIREQGLPDDFYDEDLVEDVLDKFLYREYEPNGKGGLFYIKNCEEDMRDLNIWSQLCYYLNNFY